MQLRHIDVCSAADAMVNQSYPAKIHAVFKPVGKCTFVAFPAMMKIVNYLPMAKPEATKLSKITPAPMSSTSSMRFFSEVIEACPIRTR